MEKLILTAREEAIAQRAAEIAVARMADEVYKQVGKSFVTKFLVWLGMAIVGFGLAKGWLKWPQ